MDRGFVFAGALPQDSDLLFPQRAAMVGLAALSKAVLGSATVVDGLTVGPNSPAALNVVVAPGSIYSLANLDATAYGALAADTTHSILKQGITLGSTALSIAPPGTAGFSQVFLIQAQFQETDSVPVTLPYYNAANPSVPYSGPGNSGASQSTRRLGTVVVQTKAGTAATTGTQTTPSADAGWTALAAVTVANGATTIVSGNIAAVLNANVDPTGTGLGVRPGRLLSRQMVATTTSLTVPAGATRAFVRAWAGGGGGGAGANTANSLGGGGGGGEYAEALVGVTAGASVTATIGAGGAGGLPATPTGGTAGGSTSFGALLTVAGGNGGGASNGTAQVGGNGGTTAPDGNFRIPGDPGGIGYQPGAIYVQATGGSSFGCGQTQVGTGPTTTNGISGSRPGQGGAGSTVGGNGGAGKAGLIIVEWYS